MQKPNPSLSLSLLFRNTEFNFSVPEAFAEVIHDDTQMMLRLSLTMSLVTSAVWAQNAWVKKKSEEETDFARLNKLVEDLEAGKKPSVGDSASELLDQAFEQWETLMDTPEVRELLSDPAAMKEAIKSNPLMQNLPGVDAMLDSETFQDPEKFKEAMHQGIQTFKSVSKDVASEMGQQFQELLTNPEKLQATVNDAMAALGLDDADPSDMLKQIPGMSDLANSPEFAKQMEQAQQYLAQLLNDENGGDSSNPLAESLGDLLGGKAGGGPPRKKPKRKLDLDDQVEIEIPDAINSRS